MDLYQGFITQSVLQRFTLASLRLQLLSLTSLLPIKFLMGSDLIEQCPELLGSLIISGLL